MKRLLSSVLLILGILAGLMQPISGAEAAVLPEESEEPAETLTEEESVISPESEEEESLLPAETPEAAPAEQAENRPVRSPLTMATSEEGIAFVNEMMQGSYGGTWQLQNAELTVNDFASRYQLELKQCQFDALVDLVMAYGSYILNSGYNIETLLGSPPYTDLQVASAFCAWVKDGDEFSQARLDRRIREIKLFLYGTYDGVCEYVMFRYVVFYPNGGRLDDNTVICYDMGDPYMNLPTASRDGKYFAGWYTAASGGAHISNTNPVNNNQYVYAHWSDTPVSDPNGAGGNPQGDPEDWPPLRPLKVSEPLIQFIKDNEGFAPYPVWDYGQYSVGHGSRYDPENSPIEISSPITKEEADYLLRDMMADFEKTVDTKVVSRSSLSYSPCQYDAMVSFTYNLGQQWIKSGNRIYQMILSGDYTEMSFVNAMGAWCHAGGKALPGLMRRRMDEANMYLNGSYVKGSTRYLGIRFNGMEGTPDEKEFYYMTGEALDYLPGAAREGHKFLGWYTKAKGGSQVTEEYVAPAYGTMTLYAHWEEGEETPPPKPSVDPESGFSDVWPGDWFHTYVVDAVKAGLFGGMSETEFMPQGNMTRGMLVTVLHRLAGSPESEAEIPFTDVPDSQWYYKAVRWAYETKIVNGMTETEFMPDGNVTREQLTTMLWRYAGYYGHDVSAEAELTDFADADDVSGYALAPVRWAVAGGILGGDNGNLRPGGSATRAECAKMMTVFSRMIGKMPEETPAGGTDTDTDPGPEPDLPTEPDPDSEPDSEPETEVTTEPVSEPETEAAPESEPETEAAPEPEPEPDSENS